MFDDAAGATWAIVGQHYLGMRRHHIERLGGSGKTRGEQEAGDQGEEEMFDRFHFETSTIADALDASQPGVHPVLPSLHRVKLDMALSCDFR